MERTKLLTLAVIGLLLLNLFTIGYVALRSGPPPHPDQPPGSGGPAALIIERLHLDARQQARYAELRDQHQQSLRSLNDEAVRLYGSYYGLLEADSLDPVRATALSQQLAQNQQAVAGVNLTHFQQLKALCRPNQQADFRRLVGDLAQLFGRPPRPNRRDTNGPAENFQDRP